MQLGATRWALRKPGTDVMILKNIFAEKFGVFFSKLLLVFGKNLTITLVFDRKHPFLQKGLERVFECFIRRTWDKLYRPDCL
jgi:hypothetical protein